MLKRHSALDSNYLPGSYSSERKIGLRFKEFRNLKLIQIASWPNTLSKTENFLKKEFNINNLPSFNKGSITEKYSLWRMEPLKWWLLQEEINYPNELGTTLDLSHAFTGIIIGGDQATLLLNRHLPIDLRENMFPVASSASSGIAAISGFKRISASLSSDSNNTSLKTRCISSEDL